MRSSRLLAGAVAGLIATVPMTIVMLALHRLLPRREQHRLPPEQITADLTQRAGLRRWLRRRDNGAVAWILHFSFGAGMGMLYAVLSAAVAIPEWAKGLTFGLLVWSSSYFGWLPAFQIHGHGHEQSPRRNGMMFTAHIIWGITLGRLVHMLFQNDRVRHTA